MVIPQAVAPAELESLPTAADGTKDWTSLGFPSIAAAAAHTHKLRRMVSIYIYAYTPDCPALADWLAVQQVVGSASSSDSYGNAPDRHSQFEETGRRIAGNPDTPSTIEPRTGTI